MMEGNFYGFAELYYGRRFGKQEAKPHKENTVVVSLATSEGGKEGEDTTETPRAVGREGGRGRTARE